MPVEAEAFTTAISHHRAGRLEQAESLYQDALRIDPAHADALHLLGVVAHQRQRHQTAIENISAAIAIKNTFAPYHCNLGAAYRALDRLDEAIACYRDAIRLDPGWNVSYYNLGNAYKDKKEYTAAIDCYRKSLDIDPDNAEAYNNLGDALKQTGQLDEAIEHHRRSVEIEPRLVEGHYNLANALKQQGLLDEAIAGYQRAIELHEGYVDAYVNIGYVFEEQGKFDEAIASYDKAISLDPQLAIARFNRAIALLRMGDFEQGWPEYESRLECRPNPYVPLLPEWDGSSLTGRSILVRGEQGIGDEIMFASCISEVLMRAEQCILECDPRLASLFQRSFPSANVVARCSIENQNTLLLNQAEVEFPSASLPRHFRRDLSSFPIHHGFLKPHTKLVEMWLSRFADLGKGLKVGISWRGGKEANVRRARSTTLDQWQKLFSTEDVVFVNLQYGNSSEELYRFRKDTGVIIHDWPDADPLRDLDHFAAEISALDFVISVDNSTVHMAGALGVPTWVLLPFAADWRWLLDRNDTPWYESVKLFRQHRTGDWQELFTRVAQNLESELQQYKSAIQTRRLKAGRL